jgi:predicted nucleic acid-binding protein
MAERKLMILCDTNVLIEILKGNDDNLVKRRGATFYEVVNIGI